MQHPNKSFTYKLVVCKHLCCRGFKILIQQWQQQKKKNTHSEERLCWPWAGKLIRAVGVHVQMIKPHTDLLHLLPVVVIIADHHGHQLGGLEKRQDLTTTHLQETSGEGRVLLPHRVWEHVAQVGLHKLLPETHTHTHTNRFSKHAENEHIYSDVKVGL